ncbi:serine hydrolase [Flavobacteriaceae bacterium TP-CH-4]|uniref:Serine hydrolase n=1 Tax=Pelagihabitans pacificus TaxID=2696054 RepID=A0A967AR39_9FLAO|nr:serine hydrolase [Pelagihabitans pacificus]NHF58447.1 serine hydrolase [Pelagihabitans pacificus]
MENHSIAKNLIYQRKLKGFTQEELSMKTAVTVRTIQRIEKGDVNPHLQTVKLLATALEIDVDDLLQLENPKEEAIQKKWLLLLHGTPLLGFVLPFCNVLFPLFLWIHKREDNPLYDRHGIKVINFQITVLLSYVLSFIALLTIEKWGFIFFISIIPLSALIVLGNIVYAVKEYKCYYPLAIPFLRFQKRKTVKSLLFLFILLTFINCKPQKTDTIIRLDGTGISKDSLTDKIDQLVNDAEVHGVAVTIFNENMPVYQRTFGYKDYLKRLALTDSTNIYGASLSKAVFSVLVMKLVEENVLDLDTPLESYLPKKIYEYEPQTRWHDNYSDLKTDSLYPQITARMCLAHTTGFANWRFFEPDQKLKVHYTPGTKYSYSGEGFVYLQVVLEKLTGKGLEELAQEIIFEPLQMNNSSYQWQPRFEKDFAYGHMNNGEIHQKDIDNEPRSGSTLETTVGDYIKFLTAILNRELLSKTSYEEIFSPQIRIRSLKHFGQDATTATTKYDSINLSCGLGWIYFETPYGTAVSKGGHGDGFQHYSILFPELGKGMLIMTNSDNGERIYKELLEAAIADKYTPWEWSNYIPYTVKTAN